MVLGSPLYMAPEIIQIARKLPGPKTYTEKVDVWAIGVISYMLLTGRNPFPGKTNDDVKTMIVTKEIDYTKEYI